MLSFLVVFAGGVSHVSFMVFIGTAMSITAFPVLARILKETGLIYTHPGAMAMGAAALDDVTAWCLLALSIALANAKNHKIALYVFLSVACFALGLIWLVRPLFHRFVKFMEEKNSKFYDGNLFSVTICMCFVCAWTTALLGVHAIFGAFIFGLIIPRESRLIHSLFANIEQVVIVITMPLYFALSGLKTDITTIHGAKECGVCILAIVVAIAGKVVGCGSMALLSGMSLRESSVIAVLMNTRGLVELIVLNVGLSAGILSVRTFSVMVIMALVTTFITSPVIELIYPKEFRNVAARRGEHTKVDERDADETDGAVLGDLGSVSQLEGKSAFRLGLAFTHLDNFQSIMKFVACIAPHASRVTASTDTASMYITSMRFLEPTETERDRLLGLNEEGRLIKIDEENTEFGLFCQNMHGNVHAGTAKSFEFAQNSIMLPLAVFCQAVGIAVNMFRIEGNPDEFSPELNKLVENHDISCLLFNWRPKDLFFQKLFWASVHSSNNLLLLFVPRIQTDAASASPRNEVAANSSLLAARSRRRSLEEANIASAEASTLQRNATSSKRIYSVAAVFSNTTTDKYMLLLLELFLKSNLALTVVLPADWESQDGGNKDFALAAKAFLSLHVSPHGSKIKVIIADDCQHNNLSGLVDKLTGTVYDLLLVGYVQPMVVVSSGASAGESAKRSRSQSITSKMLEMIDMNTHVTNAGQLDVIIETAHDPELGVLAATARDHASCMDADIVVLHNSRNILNNRRSSFATVSEHNL
jgi:Kef-type K+ transport system membrane component KefB